MKSIMKSKGGWLEIVEAFVAVLLIAGVILVLLNRGYLNRTDISDEVYKSEVSILREIERNYTMRTQIINIAEPMPVEWEDSRFPIDVKNTIISRIPDYLDCVGKICYLNQSCTIERTEEEDIYSQAVAITSTLQDVNYRKLNLFCWVE